MKKNISPKMLALLTGAILMSGVAQADIHINNSATYSTNDTNARVKDLSDNAYDTAKQLAVLGEILKGFANGTYTAAQVTQEINNSGILKNGDTFTLYKQAANQANAPVSSEPLHALGAGSQFGTNPAGGADLANVASVTLNGKTYTFAGSTTSGGIAVGSPTNTRTITNVSAGRLSDTSVDAINGSQLHATNKALGDLADQVNINKTNIGKGWNVKSGTTTNNIQLGDTLTVSGGDNIIAELANKELTLKLSKDLTGLNSATFTGGVKIDANGINAGNQKVTNVAPGTISSTSTDAINGSQLNDTNTNVTNLTNKVNQGWTARTDDGKTQNVQMGDTLGIKGGTNTQTSIDANGNVVVDTKQDLTLNSTTYNGGVKINNSGINAGDKKVTNVDDGDINVSSKDAVNGSQIFKLKNDLENKITNSRTAKGFTVKDADGNTQKVVDDGELNIAAKDSNVTFGVENGKVQVGLNKDLTLNSTTYSGGVKIDNDGINAGNHKVTNVAPGTISSTSTDAVNGSQLFQTNTNVTNLTNKVNQGWNVTTDDGKTKNVQMGDTLGVAGGTNTQTSIDANGKVVVDTKQDLTLNSTTYNGGVKIDNSGINAGGKKITNVADGEISSTSTDAINGSQLLKHIKKVAGGGFTAVAEDGKKVEVTAGGDFNVVGGKNIETTVNNNGQFVVQTKKDVEFDTAKVGNININDNGKITNVDDGIIAYNSKDVVNGGQIYNLKNDLENKIEANNKTLKQGIASAFAANIQYPEQRPGQIAAGVGVGYYDGESAAAIGVNFLTENGKVKLNATYGQGLSRGSKPGGKVSVGWVF